MSFINVTLEQVEIAINLDQVKYARFTDGALALYFEGVTDEELTLQGAAAATVWQGMIRIR